MLFRSRRTGNRPLRRQDLPRRRHAGRRARPHRHPARRQETDGRQGLPPGLPRAGNLWNVEGYFQGRAHANLFYSNWINYYVYQETPYDINQIK